MAAKLVRPKSLYLDTAGWRRLCDEPSGGTLWPALYRMVNTGLVIPVLSFTHLQEFQAMSQNTLRCLDSRLGELVRRGAGKWVRDYHSLQYLEINGELRRQGFEAPAPSDPFVPSLLEPIGAALLDNELVFPGFSNLVAWTTATRDRVFRDLGPGFAEFQRRQREVRGHTALTDADVLIAIRPYLPDAYAGKFPDGFKLERERMPFIQLMFGFFSGSLLSDSEQASDLLDVLHLGGVAYSDVGFVDRVTFDRLSRGRELRKGIYRNGELESVLTDSTLWDE